MQIEVEAPPAEPAETREQLAASKDGQVGESKATAMSSLCSAGILMKHSAYEIGF